MGPFLVNIAPSMFRVASPFLISSTPTGRQAGISSPSELERDFYFCSNVFWHEAFITFCLIHRKICTPDCYLLEELNLEQMVTCSVLNKFQKCY